MCFWAREPPQGRPGDHAGMEPWKTTKESLFWDPLFGPALNKSLYVFVWRFFVLFFYLIFTNFLVSEHPRAPIWSPFGYQVDDISNECGKVATAFSLESWHQTQAFQGLCVTMIHAFLIRVAETCDVHHSSKALFTLCTIYGPIQHHIWGPNLQ